MRDDSVTQFVWQSGHGARQQRLHHPRLEGLQEQRSEIVAADAMGSAGVRRVLARAIGRRGAPTRLRSDNGGGFLGAAVTDWLPAAGTT